MVVPSGTPYLTGPSVEPFQLPALPGLGVSLWKLDLPKVLQEWGSPGVAPARCSFLGAALWGARQVSPHGGLWCLALCVCQGGGGAPA